MYPWPPWMMPPQMGSFGGQPTKDNSMKEMIRYMKWLDRQNEIKEKHKAEKEKEKKGKDDDKKKPRVFNYLESVAITCILSFPVAVVGLLSAIGLGHFLKAFLDATLK